jgi:DNA modification methylase
VSAHMTDLRHGDCLELMQSIPDGSIDAVICDPPYGSTQCKWDSIIPFEPMWEQLKRVIKKNGAIVLFGSEPFSSALRMSNIKMYKYDWIWSKDTKSNFPQANHQPLNNIENIIVFSKGYARNFPKGSSKLSMLMTYNPQFTEGSRYKLPNPSKTTEIFNLNHRNGVYKHKEKDTTKRFPFSTLNINALKGKSKQHPTQKPVALMEYLIKTYTNEGETVLDFAMGSGTTMLACQNLNRNGIGIEKDDKYFEIAKNRMKI